MTSEFDLIAKYFAPLSEAAEGALGLEDDAAFLSPPPGMDLVLTKDAMVEGVHFRAEDPPQRIAQKLARVNLSDLAAKGAKPHGYLLAVSLRSDVEADWLAGFASGLSDDQKRYGWTLLGGDTVSTPGPLTFSLTAIGLVRAGAMIQRKGAKPGDEIYVSGTIGDGFLGLQVLEGRLKGVAEADYLSQRYQLPQPRLALGQRLVGLASAALDISDGFFADLTHLAEASAVGARIDMGQLPLSGAAEALVEAGKVDRQRLAAGGDDYELCFTAAPQSREAVEAAALATGTAITRLGVIETYSKARLIDPEGQELQITTKGYDHFRT